MRCLGVLYLLVTYLQWEVFAGRNLVRRYDVGIVLDRSEGVGRRNVDNTKAFITLLLSRFSVGPSRTRMALVSFASHPKTEHGFKETMNREYFLTKLNNISYSGGKSNINRALIRMHKLFEKESRNIARRILFIFTDGRLSESAMPRNILRSIRQSRLHSFVFGIGRRPNRQGLMYLSYGLSARHFTTSFFPEHYASIIDLIAGSSVSYTECEGRGYVQDECSRVCTCIDGVKSNCYRVRKEFNEMSYKERVRYVNAFKIVSNSKRFRSRYETLIRIHPQKFCKGIHFGDQFLPWHRWYVWEFENLLREVDCRITVPYWDWSYWYKDPWSKKHTWKAGPDGLGGDGNPNKTLCVDTGPFKMGEWEMPSYYNSSEMKAQLKSCDAIYMDVLTNESDYLYPCLRRHFTEAPASYIDVRRLLHLPAKSFSSFVYRLISTYHDNLHNQVGGDMCTDFASMEPVFFLHHNFLDKIWFLWQSISKAHKQVTLQHSEVKLLTTDYHAKDFYDAHNLPMNVKVTFSSFGQFNRMEDDAEDKHGKGRHDGSDEYKFVILGVLHLACANMTFHEQDLQHLAAFLKQKDFPYDTSLLRNLDYFNLT